MREYSIITGASGLLGQQHAIALAEAGFNLILTDIDYLNLNKFQNRTLNYNPFNSWTKNIGLVKSKLK